MTSIENLIVTRDSTLRDALQRLQETARSAVLMVDDKGRLLRTVTDGDVRRRILAGASLDQTLEGLPAQPPVVRLHPSSPTECLLAMNERQVDQLPLVDADGRPVALLLRREL